MFPQKIFTEQFPLAKFYFRPYSIMLFYEGVLCLLAYTVLLICISCIFQKQKKNIYLLIYLFLSKSW